MQSVSELSIKHYGVDWLTLTIHFEVTFGESEQTSQDEWGQFFANLAINQLGLPEGELIAQNPVAHYENCYIQKGTGALIQVPLNMKYQGMRVILSGETLKSIPEHEKFVGDAIEKGWKFTRVDWCIDVVGLTETVLEYFVTYLNGKPTMIEPLKEGWHESDSATFELGARTSAIWSKIYEKGKHEKQGDDWIRMECEFKEGYAMQVAHSIAACRHKEICGILVDRYKFLRHTKIYDCIKGFCDGTAKLVLRSERKSTNTKKWLWGVVRSTFINFAGVYPDEAQRWLSNLSDTLEAVKTGKGIPQIPD